MEATYLLRANEIDDNFIQMLLAIKGKLKNKFIRITVEEEVDETTYLLNNIENRKHLLQNINSDKQVIFKGNEFSDYVKNMKA